MRTILLAAISVVTALAVGGQWLAAEETATTDTAATSSTAGETRTQSERSATKEATPAPPPKLPEPKSAKRLSPEFDVWVDAKKGIVIVDGQVSLREGMLEMFACTRHTKEHESIVSANTRAYVVHAALMALGAEPGHPARFVPSYEPPTGTEIDITVEWRDKDGKTKQVRAQEWVKDIKTGKPMTQPWVFGGSRFWTDPESGNRYYQAEGGDFICVSNFGTAMLDIPVESSQANEELAFQTFTDRIPPLGTPVRLILKPKVKKQDSADKARPAADRAGEEKSTDSPRPATSPESTEKAQ